MPLMYKRARTAGGRFMAAPRRGAGYLSRMARRGVIPRTLASRVHAFKRVGEVMSIGSSSIVTTLPSLTGAAGSGSVPYLQLGSPTNGFVQFTQQFGGAFTFALAQCSQVADITNLFDNYRIKRVVLRFDYTCNQAPASNGTIGSLMAVPLIHVTPDQDDNGLPTARGDVLANSLVRTYRMDKSFSITLTPRAQTSVAVGVNASGIPNTYGAGGMLPANTWLDNAATQVPHFGAKIWVEDYNVCGAGNAAIRITPIYYIEAKNVV